MYSDWRTFEVYPVKIPAPVATVSAPLVGGRINQPIHAGAEKAEMLDFAGIVDALGVSGIGGDAPKINMKMGVVPKTYSKEDAPKISVRHEND